MKSFSAYLQEAASQTIVAAFIPANSTNVERSVLERSLRLEERGNKSCVISGLTPEFSEELNKWKHLKVLVLGDARSDTLKEELHIKHGHLSSIEIVVVQDPKIKQRSIT